MGKNITFLKNIILSNKIVHIGVIFLYGLVAQQSFAEEFKNPLNSEISTVPELVEEVLEIVVEIGVVLLGIMIVYSGFLFVTARGNDEKLLTAKKAFTYTVIGGAIVLGAWALSLAIKDTIDEIKNTT